MKNRIIRCAAACVGFFLLSATVSASCSVNACDGIGTEAVVKIMPISNGDVLLQAPADAGNLNCTLYGGNKMVIAADNTNKNIYVSTLLTGIALGKPLRVRITEGSSNCEVAYVWMDS